jgi:hypothetical protein
MIILLGLGAAVGGCKTECCEFVCIDGDNYRCQTEKVADKSECKEVVEEICGQPAAEGEYECVSPADGGPGCVPPAHGMPWEFYESEGSACTKATWTDAWCGDE